MVLRLPSVSLSMCFPLCDMAYTRYYEITLTHDGSVMSGALYYSLVCLLLAVLSIKAAHKLI